MVLGLGGTTALPAAAASTASPAKTPCKAEHLKRYPGDSTPPRWRFGELDYSVTVCPSQNPSDWSVGAKWETNKVGQANGIFVDSAKLQALQTDEDAQTKSATYDGDFVVKTCIPLVEWPCGRTYREHVFFTVTVTKATGAVRVSRISHSILPPGLSLYDTP
ncbi:hypothetical protein ACQEU8_01505 [Streptomyces sp. CA-250714]|uniref:hypothetical protein n=1 Tax=Streptomyces sp. CA-250714 TaxID=3240060 RepID=UPI003D94A369